MIDVFAAAPGSSAVEVERRFVAPLEKEFWSIPGVEYVYSTSSPDRGFLVVRFRVGEDPDRALVRVRGKLDAIADRWPPDLPPPLVKARSIDDVPIWALTFWSRAQDSATQRQLAAEVENEIKTIPEVSDTALIGGLRREFRVELDPARLAARGLAPGAVLPAIAAANHRLPAGPLVADDREVLIEAGGFVRSAEELSSVVVAESGGRPVRLGDVARVVDGPEEPAAYVTHGEPGVTGRWPAVTLSVSKRRGANAIAVVRAIEKKLDALKPRLLRRRRLDNGHARLRGDFLGEVQRAPEAHGARDALRRAPHGVRARAPRGGGRAARRARHARPDALRLRALRLHAQPHHALRPDLLDRDPRGRRDCRGREHRAAPSDAGGARPAARRGRRGGDRRGRQPDDPRDLRGHRGDRPDGLRRRADGALHAPDPDRRLLGDALLALRRLRGVSLGGAPPLPRRPGRRSRGRRGEGGISRAPLPPGDDAARDGGERPRADRLLRHDRRAPPRRPRSPAARRRARQDAPLRQQERVPGRRRFSGGDDPGDEQPRARRDGGRSQGAPGSRRHGGLRGDGRAV